VSRAVEQYSAFTSPLARHGRHLPRDRQTKATLGHNRAGF
jgi:hypothetical protein